MAEEEAGAGNDMVQQLVHALAAARPSLSKYDGKTPVAQFLSEFTVVCRELDDDEDVCKTRAATSDGRRSKILLQPASAAG